MLWSLLWPLLWLAKSLLAAFSLVLLLTLTWRAYLLVWRRSRRLAVRHTDAVLITGATSGIGLALAKHLFKLGYSVLACYYDSRESGLAELKRLAGSRRSPGEQQQQQQQQLLLVELDVRSEQSVAAAYAHCQEQLERHQLRLYALINNAGVGALQPFAWLQRKTIRNIVETNLLGSLLVTREFLPLLAEHGRARLVQVSSALGFTPGANYATYGATKAAAIYLNKCLNVELAQRFGVRSVAVIPHNFIKLTNICAHNAANNERAWEELKPLERRLYKSDFDLHCQLARSLEEASRAHLRRASERPATPSGPLSWLAALASLLRGENEATSIEQSGALECFEDALRLEEPPEDMFAGDTIFALLVSSLLLSIPASCCGLLGKSVTPGLYR